MLLNLTHKPKNTPPNRQLARHPILALCMIACKMRLTENDRQDALPVSDDGSAHHQEFGIACGNISEF